MSSTRRSRFFAIVLACTGVLALVYGQGGKDEKAAPAAGSASKFIGADKCKTCHSSEAAGNPHGHWLKSGHAKAFETLASDKAKEIAKAKGIEDAQKSDQCLKCHQTAFGLAADRIKKGFDAKDGVQCETCHGPGEEHFKARFAAAAKAGDSNERQTVPAGEIIASPGQDTCLGCHNAESPTFKPFCFHMRAASIAHRDPRKTRTPEEILVCGCEKCACEKGCEKGCGVPEKKK